MSKFISRIGVSTIARQLSKPNINNKRPSQFYEGLLFLITTLAISSYVLNVITQDYSNDLVKFAISIATAAASQPLFPALVPALSIACSIVSVVNTPNTTGISC